MKATELRIGNYVLARKSDEFDLRICKVFEIRNKFFRLIELSTNLMFDQTRFEPIPLTEKWLMDFGFTDYQKTDDPEHLNEYGQDWHKIFEKDFYFINNDRNDGWRVCMSGACYDESTGLHVISNEIKFVHQLQNIYFALTETELTNP